MAKYVIEDTTLTNIASAIREKTGKSELLLPSQMPSEIQSISSGGEDFEINDASYLFYNGARINILNDLLSRIKSPKSFSYCFYGSFNSIKQETLDLSTIDMSNCSTFHNMFYNTNFTLSVILKNIVLPNNLKSAIDCYGMFRGVYLPSLDLSSIIFENIINAYGMFENAKINNLILPNLKVNNAGKMFYQFSEDAYDDTVPFNDTLDISSIDFSECTAISSFIRYSEFAKVLHNNFDCSKVTNVSNFASNNPDLKNLCPLLNLGKGYTQKSANYNSYKLDLSSCVNLTHDSLLGIINGLYDLNLTYDVAGGGTLYTQQLVLGSTNLAKLTEDEIAIGTNKGWVVS